MTVLASDLQRHFRIPLINRSSGVVVVICSWLAEQEVRGSIPGLAATISEIGYLLLPSRDMAEIPLLD